MVITSVYERSFTSLVFPKNKRRNRLNVDNDSRLKLSNCLPNIDNKCINFNKVTVYLFMYLPFSF